MIIKFNKIRPFYIVIVFTFFTLFISSSLHTSVNNVKGKNYMFKECLNPIYAPSYISDSFAVKLDTFLEKLEFNGSILIEYQHQIVYKKNIGYRKLPKKELINDSTVFQLASVSKQFTSVAVMILKEKGLLDYNDLVKKHIPEFPYDTITIKHLLTHTSGLQNYLWLIEKNWNKKSQPTNEDLLSLFIEHKLPLNFDPGARFLYSNTGYCFLALLVERISKKKMHDFMQEYIFKPLEMNNTYLYHGASTKNVRNRAYGFKNRRGRWIAYTDTLFDAVVGDKGIYSTANDLYKWNLAINNRLILSDSTLNEAMNPFPLDSNRYLRYGYGWRIREIEGEKMVYHNGTWQGFKTSCIRLPNHSSTIIILNNTHKRLHPIIGRIKELIYKNDSLFNINVATED